MPPGVTPSAEAVDLEGRLIAEAARIYEAGLATPLDDERAVAAGRAATGDLEHKVVARARSLPVAAAIAAALGQLRGVLRLTVAGGLLLAGCAGALTALTALDLPAGQAVNFHWALLGLLGLETIVLLLWIALVLLRPEVTAVPSFGLLFAALGRRLAGWIGRRGGEGPQAAALRAAAALTGRGAVARWSMSAVSHGIWLAFLAGALAMTLVLLSVKQVAFVWQTTILTESSYVPATEALSALPSLVGFPVPTRAEITASRWLGPDHLPSVASRAWSGLLVGSLVLYGLAPRGILLALCVLLWRRAAGRVRLDLGQPAYQRLRERLAPSVRHEGVIDGEDGDRGSEDAALAREDLPAPEIAFSGPVALFALEIEPPAGLWPPAPAPADGWRDLGPVDGREERARALEACADPALGLVLVAASLLSTPDRGLGAFLTRLRAAAGAPVVLLLSDRTRLADRLGAGDAAQRLADWRRLVVRAGLPAEHAMLFELSDPGAADHGRLAALLGAGRP